MAAPLIVIDGYTRARISNQPGLRESVVQFLADQDLVDWQARADGAGVGQGDLVGQAPGVRDTWAKWDAQALSWASLDAQTRTWETLIVVLPDNDIGEFVVDAGELTWGDKVYRINVYGKNQAGEWTAYGG
ncbi:hypothetical protein B1748_29180 [Paenibacillus sp. MY03]|uniref:hypothetical protein n=1 Tax=Paenibacillus sp. MY03 TaxID=302980 RepID=UPI000B3CD0BB|nr:hypothetical protein [Paenibacillus sp. MY03]OUS70310.1 hypothetical protein B1748_29180 [Paenibacillus sp. MY03]